MSGDIRLVDIAAEIRHRTEKAFLLFDGTRGAWVPKSRVPKSRVPKSLAGDNGDGTFTMPEWLAGDKGFI